VKRTPVYFLAAACAVLLVAGCGSSKKKSEPTQAATPTTQPTTTQSTTTAPSGGAAAQGGSTLQLSADPSGQLKFDKTSLTAKAGKVTLEMANPSSVPHGIAVKGNGIDKKGPTASSQGTASKIAVTLKAGKYEFYCPVDGHEQAGMKGTLTVK
jgi:uncharacterized cupredoxin-like copper-binding protein